MRASHALKVPRRAAARANPRALFALAAVTLALACVACRRPIVDPPAHPIAGTAGAPLDGTGRPKRVHPPPAAQLVRDPPR